jgi:hypothetical protein
MNSIKLEKGIVNLMLPFRLGSEPDLNKVIENEIWTKADDSPRLEFLLDHVREFFTKNIQNDKTDESACFILKLKKDALPVKMFNNKTYWLSNKPFNTEKKPEKLLRLSVYFDPGSFRIIYHPFTANAILLYSVELVNLGKNEDKYTLDDFIRMNYLLRTFNRQDEAFLISKNERPEERSKAALLLKTGSHPLFSRIDDGNIESAGWRPCHLINLLLSEINSGSTIQFFNPSHFVPFSYFQPDAEILDESITHNALFYLRNVYDFDYTPSLSDVRSEEEFLHPYKQICYAASIEGAVIFNNSGESDPEFIRTFYSGSFKNSLWVAILGLMQRSIFLQLMKEVSDVDMDDHIKIKEYLKRYTSTSVKAIFSKISVYHQHNDFYDLIIKKLQINELQTELKDELHGLNNLQRQFHEDEMERLEDIEKQYEKRLNIILFVLSVLSLAQITYVILENITSMPFIRHCMAIGIPVIVGIVFWQVLKIRKK